MIYNPHARLQCLIDKHYLPKLRIKYNIQNQHVIFYS